MGRTGGSNSSGKRFLPTGERVGLRGEFGCTVNGTAGDRQVVSPQSAPEPQPGTPGVVHGPGGEFQVGRVELD